METKFRTNTVSNMAMADDGKEVGANREVTEYLGPGHDSRTETHDDPGPCECFSGTRSKNNSEGSTSDLGGRSKGGLEKTSAKILY